MTYSIKIFQCIELLEWTLLLSRIGSNQISPETFKALRLALSGRKVSNFCDYASIAHGTA